MLPWVCAVLYALSADVADGGVINDAAPAAALEVAAMLQVLAALLQQENAVHLPQVVPSCKVHT